MRVIRQATLDAGFHSIVIPSEWEFRAEVSKISTRKLFPFNCYPQRVGITSVACLDLGIGRSEAGFHSIVIPSEWEFGILLVGDLAHLTEQFPFNCYPQRVGIKQSVRYRRRHRQPSFPFNCYPQRVGI